MLSRSHEMLVKFFRLAFRVNPMLVACAIEEAETQSGTGCPCQIPLSRKHVSFLKMSFTRSRSAVHVFSLSYRLPGF